jgi:hypothetical protein
LTSLVQVSGNTVSAEQPHQGHHVPEVLIGLWVRYANFAQRPCIPLAYPHAVQIRSDPATRRAIAAFYHALPPFATDDATARAFAAFRDDVREQFEFLTTSLEVHVTTSRTDPYPSADRVIADLHDKRLMVLATAVTGRHPYLSDDDNDMFRAVHDAFGHAVIGRGFDRHGEEAAWAVHSAMFTPLARDALTIETRGQSAATIESIDRGFVEQKVGLLPHFFTSLSSVSKARPELRTRKPAAAYRVHSPGG